MTRYFGNKIVPALANLKTFSFLCRNCFRVQLKRNIMKYKLLFRLLFTLPLLIPIETVAQGVYVSNQPFHDTAIVRPFGEENFMLTYMDSAFYLYQTGLNTAEYFHVPFIVNDMEIWEDSVVFFCGRAEGYGVMGRFNIMDVFSYNFPINYAVTNISPSAPYVGTLDVVDLTRLTLFLGTTPNTVVMAMVCRERLDAYPNEIRSGVMGAVFDPSGWWPMSVYYNKDGVMRYHDIEALDDMVVATMTDTNNLGCYVRPFDKNNYFFPNTPFASYGGDEIVLRRPMGPPQITKWRDNMTAVVQFDQISGLITHFLEFDATTGIASAISPSALVFTSTGYQNGNCGFNGACFDAIRKTLYVLGTMSQMGNGLLNRWLLEIQGVDTTSHMLIHWLTESKPFSMDMGGLSHRPVVSGSSDSGDFLDWDINIPQQNHGCKELYTMDIDRWWPEIRNNAERGSAIGTPQINIRFFPIKNKIQVNPECMY